MPLLKMTLRMFFFSAAIFTVSHTLIHFFFDFLFDNSSLQPLSELSSLALTVALWSVVPALVLALPLPLVTVLFFREISRPAFYRFAMLTVALIATITVWGEHYAMLGQLINYNFAGYAAAIVAGNSLAIFMSVIVADKYVRDVAARQNKVAT